MEKLQKFKINCLKFILENNITKSGSDEFRLASKLFEWGTIPTIDMADKQPEFFEVTPDMKMIESAFESPFDVSKPAIKSALRGINRDPKRMKQLAGIAPINRNQNTNASFSNQPIDSITKISE